MDCGAGLGNQVCQSSDKDCTVGGGSGYSPLPDETDTYFFTCDTIGCCPTSNTVTACDGYVDNEHCIINCTTSDNCDNAVIDAVSIATVNNIPINKLTLNCDSCEDSIIQCPAVECNVNCKDCRYSSIVTSNSVNVNVICNDYCYGINIKAQNVDTLNFECKSGTCFSADLYNLYNINNLNVLCTDDCGGLDIWETYNVTNLHFACVNESACWGSSIDIKEISNVNIECLSHVSCLGDYYFYNLSNEINITCSNLQRNKVVGISGGPCSKTEVYVFNSVYMNNVVSNTICDSEDCSGAYFEFDNIAKGYLTCNNYRACYTVELHTEQTGEVFIHCNGANACDYMDLYAPYSISTQQSVHISCYGDDTSCQGLRVQAITNFMPNFLQLNCTNNTNAHCIGTNSHGITVYCQDIRYSNKYNWLVDPPTTFIGTYSNNKFGCRSNKCCPWLYPEIITCASANTECIIDCSQDSNNCINKYINFDPSDSNLTSLTVKCNTYQSCSWAVIICPTICNIECTADESCEYLRVEYGNNSFSKVNMSCTNSLSNVVNICYELELYGYDAQNINFECNKALCKYVTIHATLASNINIDCISAGTDFTCQFFKLNAYNVSSNVDINCIGYRACWYPEFDLYFSNNIMINAREDDSWYVGYVGAFYASYLTINCSSEKYQSACVSIDIHLPSATTGFATINCFGTGCKYLNIFEANGNWNHITFNYNECQQCNGFDCITDINIECIRIPPSSSSFSYSQYENMTDIRSNVCTKNQTCSCNAIRQQFIDNHVNDYTNPQCLLGPTTSPTPAPTHEPSPEPIRPPTKFPTGIPTVTPTNNPSSSPSNMPSIAPSYPTNEPTCQPTILPTTFPSDQPSKAPTVRPNRIVLPTSQSTAIATVDDGLDASDNESGINISGAVIGVVIVGIILVAIFVYCCLCINKNKKYAPSEKMKVMNQAQQIQPVPVQQVQQPMIVQLVQASVMQNNNNQQQNETAGAQLMQMHQYMNNPHVKYNGVPHQDVHVEGEGDGEGQQLRNNANQQQYTLQ